MEDQYTRAAGWEISVFMSGASVVWVVAESEGCVVGEEGGMVRGEKRFVDIWCRLLRYRMEWSR